MMRAFSTLTGLVVPLDRANVDTDAILPKQFMKSVRRTGFGDYLFDQWRYEDSGVPGQDCRYRPRVATFPLNHARFQGAEILLARENFGCGSSREHAVWALSDFGIRAIVASSFAEIFHANCMKNGLLPVVLDAGSVETLFERVAAAPGYRLTVDLVAQTVVDADGLRLRFEIGADARNRLLRGIDDIAVTLNRSAEIAAYEVRRREQEPWLFSGTTIQQPGQDSAGPSAMEKA